MQKGPIKETRSAKELLRSPIQVTFNKNEPNSRDLTLTKIRPETPMSTDQDVNFTKIVDGFTPGAVKNVLCVDRTGIFIYSAKLDKIRFESFTKFGEEVNELNQIDWNRSRSRVSIEILKEEAIVLIVSSLNKRFNFWLNNKTGEIGAQSVGALPETTSQYFHRSILSTPPKKSKTAVYTSFVDKNHNQKIYLTKKDRISYVMSIPQIPSQQDPEQPRRYQNYNLERTNIFICNIKGKHTALLTRLAAKKLILTAHDPVTKKTFRKIEIHLDDIMGQREFKRKNQALISRAVLFARNVRVEFKDVSYSEEQGRVVGRITIGTTQVTFSFGDILGAYLSTLRISVQGFQSFVTTMKVVNLKNPIILTKPSNRDPNISKIWSLDAVSQKLSLDLKIDGKVYNKFGSLNFQDLVSLDERRILMITDTCSQILDIQEKRIVSRVDHRFKINLDDKNFAHLDNLLVWTSKAFVHIARFSEAENQENDLRIDLKKDVSVQNYFYLNQYQRSHPLNIYFFRISTGDYALYFMNSNEAGGISNGLNRMIFDQKSLEVKEARELPGLNGFNLDSEEFVLYKTLDFLVFSCHLRPHLLKPFPGLDVNTTYGPHIRLHLATLQFELLDSSAHPLLFDESERTSPIVCINDAHIISKASFNSLILHQIDTENKKLVLMRIFDLQGLTIQPSYVTKLSTTCFSLFCYPQNQRGQGLGVIVKFSSQLKLLGSFTGNNLRGVRRLVLLNNGKVAFEERALAFGGHELGWEHFAFEVDFEQQKIIHLNSRSIGFYTPGIASHPQYGYMIDAHPDGVLLYKLDT